MIVWIPPADLALIKDQCRCGAKLPARVIIDGNVICHSCAENALKGTKV